MSGVLHAIAEWSRCAPTRAAHTYLDTKGFISHVTTYDDLWSSAGRVATWLQHHTAPRDRVAIMIDTGQSFLVTFLGCLMAGRIAVPVNPPSVSRASRAARICTHAGVACVITTRVDLVLHRDRLTPHLSSALRYSDFEGIVEDTHILAPLPEISDDEIAFLQYTSGSTADPKGVIVSHANILANVRLKSAALCLSEDSVLLSWLPHHHDAGLIWGNLLPLVTGSRVYSLSPRAFAADPLVWIESLSRYGATMTAAPDFAYVWCARKVDHHRLAGCSLGRLSIALNAADMIRHDSMREFVRTFSSLNLQPSVMRPGYGLAESTLYVTSGEWSDEIDPKQHCGLVSCGLPPTETRLAIVDPDTHLRCAPGIVGEVWIQGDTVAKGYWRNDDETTRTFHARIVGDSSGDYLRTGDLGFLDSLNGSLYICGRLKNIIIYNGQKYHQEDLERTIHDHVPEVAPLGAAILQRFDGEVQQVLAVLEITSTTDRPNVLANRVRREIAIAHGLTLNALYLVSRGFIRKTTSGKIQRHETLRYLDHNVECCGLMPS